MVMLRVDDSAIANCSNCDVNGEKIQTVNQRLKSTKGIDRIAKILLIDAVTGFRQWV